ncbi:DUF1652 domain-containing protein [Pseudomonas sp. 4810-S13]|uniref:DUF1652 domain-containing protein n=1 Tax=Pseudomonas sp. 4810-S13 TaxID=3120822 RepID=UPI0031B6A91E
MISLLELRHIIETAFLPMQCVCTIDADNRLMIQLINPVTQVEELTVAGIDPVDLSSSRAIAKFVVEIKEEARLRRDASVRSYRRA